MTEFEKALEIVGSSAQLLDKVHVNLQQSLNRILACDVLSDMDMPPFDKSAVDGYACRRSDLGMELRVREVIPAGKIPEKRIAAGECAKIMTGGMLPAGADTVLMVEDVTETGENTIFFNGSVTAPNFCPQAEDFRKETTLLKAGTMLRPQEIAILATIGCTNPLVYCQPRVGIVATGSELVEPHQHPSLSQIRNSNSMQLLAQAQRAGCLASYLGIAPDDPEITFKLLQQAANGFDIILFTGGVSVGDYDFVPDVIVRAGFDIKIRSMAVQPGKPLIFAMRNKKFLIGLPGNPVSSFVQFELLVRHLIRKMTGQVTEYNFLRMPLGTDYSRRKAERRAFFPVNFSPEGFVNPVEYHGSAHMLAYLEAQGIASVPVGVKEMKKGDLLDVRLI